MIPYAEPVFCHFSYQQCVMEGGFTDFFGADMPALSRMVSDEEVHLTPSVKAWKNDGSVMTANLGCCVQVRRARTRLALLILVVTNISHFSLVLSLKV